VVYVPQSQQTSSTMSLVARTGGDPWTLLPLVRRAVEGLDSGLLLTEARTLEGVMAESMAGARYRMSILGAFAAVALALAAVGIYGVLSYSVSQSRRDIGIRMALGAEAARVRRHVLAEGLAHVGWGVAAGVAATVAFTRYLASLVYGVSVTEPATVAAVAAVLVAVAFTACAVPAHRATRIDPIRVLREE
jgi:ABC-type antimicrobial peptide transport system permease subunit